jgi:hypothetical protein
LAVSIQTNKGAQQVVVLEDEIKELILMAIVTCEIVDQDGDPTPAVPQTATAKALADAVFERLKAKGVLTHRPNSD